MNGEHYQDIGKSIHEAEEGVTYSLLRRSLILPAMGSDQNHPEPLRGDACQHGVVAGFAPAQHILESVDDAVSRDPDLLAGDPLAQQVVARFRRGREMGVGEDRGEVPVDFFGKWIELLTRAQSRFDMGDGDLVIEGCEGPHEGGRSVPLNHNEVGLFVQQDGVETLHGARRNLGQALPGTDDIQIMVRPDQEQFQDLVQHFAMLGRDDRDGSEALWMFLETPDQWCELYGFGSCAKYDRELERWLECVTQGWL